jgi:hypothetical protein
VVVSIKIANVVSRFIPRNARDSAIRAHPVHRGATLAERIVIGVEAAVRIEDFSFGHITIGGVGYEHDVVIDHGSIRKRKKKPSRKFRGAFGHTPLSAEENIPWKCRRLVIGTGTYGNLPVMDDVKREAARRGIELVILPTAEAIRALRTASEKTNAILHVTC